METGSARRTGAGRQALVAALAPRIAARLPLLLHLLDPLQVLVVALVLLAVEDAAGTGCRALAIVLLPFLHLGDVVLARGVFIEYRRRDAFALLGQRQDHSILLVLGEFEVRAFELARQRLHFLPRRQGLLVVLEQRHAV